MTDPAQESGLVKQTLHINGGYIYEAHFECHAILMLGKSPIKWGQCSDMIIAVDWDVKHKFKQIFRSGIHKTFEGILCQNAIVYGTIN